MEEACECEADGVEAVGEWRVMMGDGGSTSELQREEPIRVRS